MSPPTPFPPPTINAWVRHHTVSTDKLIQELREWADYLEEKSK